MTSGQHGFIQKKFEVLSRLRPRRKAKSKKQFVFAVLHTRHHPRVCFFFGGFSFRGPSARCSVFWCKIVAFMLRVPSRPLLPFCAEHAFLAFFRAGDLQFFEARRLGLVRLQGLSGSHRLLAVSRSSRGWPACCRQVTPGKLGCGLPLRGHRGPGQSIRASALLSRVLTEAGVTPAVHLRGLLRLPKVRRNP